MANYTVKEVTYGIYTKEIVYRDNTIIATIRHEDGKVTIEDDDYLTIEDKYYIYGNLYQDYFDDRLEKMYDNCYRYDIIYAERYDDLSIKIYRHNKTHEQFTAIFYQGCCIYCNYKEG